MNKIYSLKYSHITGGLVAVSELTKKVSIASRKNSNWHPVHYSHQECCWHQMPQHPICG